MAVLASGSFGRVVRVQHRLLGKEYVIKRSAMAIVEEGTRRAWCQVLIETSWTVDRACEPVEDGQFVRRDCSSAKQIRSACGWSSIKRHLASLRPLAAQSVMLLA